MIKNILKTLIFSTFALTMISGFTGVAFAQTVPLSVQFVPDPLFVKANFLPNDETSGQVTVTNNSGNTQTLLTEAINITDNDNFGSLLRIKITNGTTIVYENSLAHFFANAGEVSLGTISNGETKVFTYLVSFINSDDNSYQGKSLGFDVCVGYEGGNNHCGNTTIGGEGDTGGGAGGSGGGTISGTGSGGGGGGNGPIIPTSLNIFNERVNEITAGVPQVPTATALITWNTNKLSTSQVVYGPSTEIYTFDINNLPAFGYPFVTLEDTTKVINHSVLLTGLIPGQSYVYRVVSRASPPSVSFEHEFTVPVEVENGVYAINTNISDAEAGATRNEGAVLGETTEVSPENTNETNVSVVNVLVEKINKNVAAAGTSGFGSLLSMCSLIALFIFLVIYFVWGLWLRPKYEEKGIPEEQIKKRFYVFFGGITGVVIVVLIILGQLCPLPILIVSFIVCIFAYLFKMLFK